MESNISVSFTMVNITRISHSHLCTIFMSANIMHDLCDSHLCCADGCAYAEEGGVAAGEGEGDRVEDVVGVHHQEVEGQVDGVRRPVLGEQPVPRRPALVQLEVLEDVGAEHLRQAPDYLKGRKGNVGVFLWSISEGGVMVCSSAI